jgi:hypothetical protein
MLEKYTKWLRECSALTDSDLIGRRLGDLVDDDGFSHAFG